MIMQIKQGLRERIQFAGNGIMIYPDKSTEAERKVFVGEFRLSYPEEALTDPFNRNSDTHNISMSMKQTKYWEAGTAHTTTVKNNTFLLVVETENGEITDSCRLYYPNNAQHRTLYIRTDKNKKYGKDAYVITIEWPDDIEPEDIGSQYIYLQDTERNRYYFLTDVIAPLENSKKQIDQYVYEIPEGKNAADYEVAVDELLKQKYDIVN